jgi:hypothetical protein
MIVFSPMAFDSGSKTAIWTFVITLLAYPVIVLITLVGAWISFAAHAYRLAIWLKVLPVVHVIVLIVEVAISS